MSDLTRFINRVERLEEEIRALQADRTAVYAEAKAAGFDPKIMRKVVAERRMKTQDRLEQEALLDTYRHELGMLADMPLGAAALKAAKNDGRAAPRAAGNRGTDAANRDSQDSPRQGTDPASPDPLKCRDCDGAIEPGHSKVYGEARPLCRRCFDLREGDSWHHPALVKLTSAPPEIPPFLDRREKAPAP